MSSPKKPEIEESWARVLADEFSADYMHTLRSFLVKEYQQGRVIYPPGKEMFQAFNLTPFEQVKVVILGQDPYHGPGQAHGLSFSVPQGTTPPPSLVNIFKELSSDLGVPTPSTGDLTPWAAQGVLLLNAILTVRAHEAASHHKQGWERFTDTVISLLSARREHIVFILWGNYAKQKAALIDSSRHHIITSAHPSPLSAHNGFFGSRPFSQTNTYLTSQGITPITWTL